MAMNPLDLLRMRKMALAGANRRPAASYFLEQPSTSSADIADAQNAYSRQGLQERSLAEAARLRALKELGLTQQPTASITKPKLITADDTASGLRSMLPGRGTPGSAALGAFGSTMSQLGGWQDKPMTFGQILGASLGEARKAYGTAEERQRKIAAEESAALAAAEEKEYTRSRQSEQDKLTERYREAQIAQMGKDTKKALNFKQQTVKDPKTGKIGKADVAYVVPGSVEAEALQADKAGRVVRWETFVPETAKTSELSPKEGIFLENGQRSQKQVYQKARPDGQGYVTVVEDKDAEGGFRPFDPSTDEFISKEQIPVVKWKPGEMRKERDLFTGERRGIKLMQNLYDALETQPKGFDKFLKDFKIKVKTFVGEGLTNQEIMQRLASGMQQGLLGQIRVDVVGPGVMTEQDAQRLIDYLGGDLNKISTDPAVVQAAIARTMRDKVDDYNRNKNSFNRQVNLDPRAGFKSFEDIDEIIMDETNLRILKGEERDAALGRDPKKINDLMSKYGKGKSNG